LSLWFCQMSWIPQLNALRHTPHCFFFLSSSFQLFFHFIFPGFAFVCACSFSLSAVSAYPRIMSHPFSPITQLVSLSVAYSFCVFISLALFARCSNMTETFASGDTSSGGFALLSAHGALDEVQEIWTGSLTSVGDGALNIALSLFRTSETSIIHDEPEVRYQGRCK